MTTDGHRTIDDAGGDLPGLGRIGAGMVELPGTSDGRFRAGEAGVVRVVATGDRKVEFVAFVAHTLAHVMSSLGYDAYYPVHPVALERPVEAVLMDLDGTSVHSEGFWVWIIQQCTATLRGQPAFEFEEADLPFVSGHSVSEHLAYCLRKYCPGRTLEEARAVYFEHTRREMRAILDGHGRVDAFTPAPGLAELLHGLKGRGIRIALATSGLYEKAYPEILAAFRTLGLGDPADFYDAIVTAGFPLGQGSAGTLGELTPKPHPWLYAEACRVGLGIPFEARHRVIGVEDSGAGACAIRLAGFTTVGLTGGNIVESGTSGVCQHLCHDLLDVLKLVEG